MAKRPPEMNPSARFTLTCGQHEHTFIGTSFPNMSKRGRSLLKRGVTSGTTKCRASQTAFQAFVSACELQKFRLTAANVFQVLNMAVEWQVKSLANFCQEFIKKKGLKPFERGNPVDWLVKRCASGSETHDDIVKVARVINDALLDDRMLSLPPEVLFEIIVNADRRVMDEQKLVTFVLRVLEAKPSTAGPLILLLNREMLTTQQRGKIVRNRKIHEQDIQFFVGWTASHMRNAVEHDIRELVGALMKREGELVHEYKKKQDHATKKLGRALVQAIEGLKGEVEENQKKINTMLQAAKREANDLAKEQKDEQTKLKALKAELDDVNNVCDIVSRHSVSAADEVKLSVGEEIEVLKKELEDKIMAVSSAHTGACDAIKAGHQQIMQEQEALIDRLFGKVDKMNSVELNLAADIDNLKSILLAKIIRDKIRSDKYIRESTHRFDLFNDDVPSWNQTAENARRAEDFIIQLESKLNTICPIRSGTSGQRSVLEPASSGVSEHQVEVVEVADPTSSSSSEDMRTQSLKLASTSSDDE